MFSKPHIDTMLGTNVSVGNQGNYTSETSTVMVTSPLLIPFMGCLRLPNLSQLINDPLLYDCSSHAMPTKIPFDTPKFEHNPGEQPTNHVCSFYMWCSFNSITEVSIHLDLLQ